MDPLTWISNGNVVLGFMLTLSAAIAGLASWFWNRVSKRVEAATTSAGSAAAKPAISLTAKVTEIERDVNDIAGDMDGVKVEIHALSNRVHEVERGMETVARQSDVAALNAEVKQMSGTLGAEVRILSGIMHTFREAALRGNDRGDGK